MPFKSEAQKRYLWANEPEIARDWTDTYGSKIHAADGGIMRLGLYQGGSVLMAEGDKVLVWIFQVRLIKVELRVQH